MSTPQAAALEAQRIASLEEEFNYVVVKLTRTDNPSAVPYLTSARDFTRSAYLQARGLTLAVPS